MILGVRPYFSFIFHLFLYFLCSPFAFNRFLDYLIDHLIDYLTIHLTPSQTSVSFIVPSFRLYHHSIVRLFRQLTSYCPPLLAVLPLLSACWGNSYCSPVISTFPLFPPFSNSASIVPSFCTISNVVALGYINPFVKYSWALSLT